MRQLLLRQGQGWKAPGWNVDGKKRKGLTYGESLKLCPGFKHTRQRWWRILAL